MNELTQIIPFPHVESSSCPARHLPPLVSRLSGPAALFRRWFPAFLALLLCSAYYQYTAAQQATRAALAAAVSAGQLNADSPQIAAAHNAEIPPFGLVTGKFIFALGLFFGGLAAVWFVLRFVVPVLPRWATAGGYKQAFTGQVEMKQLRTFNTVWLCLLGYFAVCVLAACLVS